MNMKVTFLGTNGWYMCSDLQIWHNKVYFTLYNKGGEL